MGQPAACLISWFALTKQAFKLEPLLLWYLYLSFPLLFSLRGSATPLE